MRERSKPAYEPTTQEKIHDKLDYLQKAHKALGICPIQYSIFSFAVNQLNGEAKLKLINKYLVWFLRKYGDPSSDPDHAEIFYPSSIKINTRNQPNDIER